MASRLTLTGPEPWRSLGIGASLVSVGRHSLTWHTNDPAVVLTIVGGLLSFRYGFRKFFLKKRCKISMQAVYLTVAFRANLEIIELEDQ